jgi:hypothetical protein
MRTGFLVSHVPAFNRYRAILSRLLLQAIAPEKAMSYASKLTSLPTLFALSVLEG